MSTFLLIIISGLGLGSLYFLLAAGLSVIFGLMRVLSFAHGAFLSASGFASWMVLRSFETPSTPQLLLALVVSVLTGGAVAYLAEVLLVRPLKGKELEQLLVTVGLGMVLVALMAGIWGPDEHLIPRPVWLTDTTSIAGAPISNSRLLLIGLAGVVVVGIHLILSRTRYGLIIRAGVENSAMVSALGINVKRAFTLVFVAGGMLAGLGGGLAGTYYGGISPFLGDGMLIFSFIVLIIGGLGSINGALIASVVLGVSQSVANYYVLNGIGDVLVVVLLVATLLVRPQGLLGQKERLI
ncbi:branched-chain amino acid ABC transporter permease [Acrocarpospora macrocephala]|uniref:Branched-chain amino acid ABC transporter permease n=1 Tax=Acrocarpospora macrocephala TaxID=150177 RepID=A0A5M3WZM6_9ACTN|nr:branched-chain amino acid ABC transporter permease [Acrocarpospora macrocephala]GES13876.1 branched-chain amino acid ABC transporter permease [Acrocarpospora macrocephala]